MASSSFRLPRKDFGKIFQQGSGITGSIISLRILPNQLSHCRAGFSVGIKFSKLAVKRNRARRLLREAFRKVLPQIKPGYDLAVYFKTGFTATPTTIQLQQEIQQLLKRKHLLINKSNN